MQPVIEHYHKLFWSPEALHNAVDFVVTAASLLPLWIACWWFCVLIARFMISDFRSRFGTATALKFIWARCALILSSMLLIDIGLVSYFDKLTDWSAITPHALFCLIGGCACLWIALRINGELKENQKKLFAALPKGNVGMAR